MFSLLLLLGVCSTAFGLFNVGPIQIENCKKNDWLVRHYIVYNCNYYNASTKVINRRELNPFACDPSNGLRIKRRKKPVFIGQEFKAADGFVYKCGRHEATGGLEWKAVACYIEGERFLPGHFVKGQQNSIYLCYKELDGLIRIRHRRPVHNHCNGYKKDDPNCAVGIIQTVFNSNYGLGTEYAVDPSTNKPLTKVAEGQLPKLQRDVPKSIKLKEDRPKVSALHMIRLIQGFGSPDEHIDNEDSEDSIVLTPEKV